MRSINRELPTIAMHARGRVPTRALLPRCFIQPLPTSPTKQCSGPRSVVQRIAQNRAERFAADPKHVGPIRHHCRPQHLGLDDEASIRVHTMCSGAAFPRGRFLAAKLFAECAHVLHTTPAADVNRGWHPKTLYPGGSSVGPLPLGMYSLIPGFGVKLSERSSLPGPQFSPQWGPYPPHDGVRRRWWMNVASAVSLIESSQKFGRPHDCHRPARDVFCRWSREPVISFCVYAAAFFRRPVELSPLDPHAVA
jgi:hypothetical protein